MGLAVTSLAGGVALSLGAGLITVACGGPDKKEVAAATVVDARSSPTTVTTAKGPDPDDLYVGDVLPVGSGGSMTVSAVEEDVSAGRLFSPPKGKDYFAAEVEACSGPDEKDLVFSPEFFTVTLESGGAVVPGLGVKKPDLRAGKIPAGKCLGGWVTWSLPEDASVASVVYTGSRRYDWKMPLPEGKAPTSSG